MCPLLTVESTKMLRVMEGTEPRDSFASPPETTNEIDLILGANGTVSLTCVGRRAVVFPAVF